MKPSLLLLPLLLTQCGDEPKKPASAAKPVAEKPAAATTAAPAPAKDAPKKVYWTQEMMQTSRVNVDPLMTSLREGGAHHTRGELPAYLRRLRETGRDHHADALAAKHPTEAT